MRYKIQSRASMFILRYFSNDSSNGSSESINRSADVPWKLFHIAKYPDSIYMTQFVRSIQKFQIENYV